jgi:hypothetical protein
MVSFLKTRVSSKQTKINFGSNRNRNKMCFAFVSVCFVKPKTKNFSLFRFVSVFRTYMEITETNRTVSQQTETNPKCYENNPNILSFKLFGWVLCLFRFSRNIKTLCFDIEAKQPKQTVSKQTEKTKKMKQKRKNGKIRKIFCK